MAMCPCTRCSRTATLYEVLAIEQGFGGYYLDETDTKVAVDDPKAAAAGGAQAAVGQQRRATIPRRDGHLRR